MEALQSLTLENLQTHWQAQTKEYERYCVNCGKPYIVNRSTASSEGFCPHCDNDFNRRELLRVQKQRRRAVRENKPATLSFRQWVDTVNYFQHKCAYCQKADFVDMEHFIPLRACDHTRGTTLNNVVPACKACNYFKKSRNPLSMRSRRRIRITSDNLDRVYNYLNKVIEM